MQKYYPIIPILIIVNLFCSTGQKINKNMVPAFFNENMDSLCFEADIDSLFIGPMPKNYEYGVDYQNKEIDHLSDSCDIFVGTDANYLLSLVKVKYIANAFNLDSAKLLRLHIHSPAQTFASAEQPGKGIRYRFKMDYKKKDSSYYRFYLLNGRKSD
jgi:hypothetical protein